MRLLVKVENLSDDDLTLQLEAYTRQLAAHPLPVVLKVIERWPESGKFWPAWSELHAKLGEAMEVYRSRQLLEHHGNDSHIARSVHDKPLHENRSCRCVDCNFDRHRHVVEMAGRCECWICERADEWRPPKRNPNFGVSGKGGKDEWKRVGDMT